MTDYPQEPGRSPEVKLWNHLVKWGSIMKFADFDRGVASSDYVIVSKEYFRELEDENKARLERRKKKQRRKGGL